MEFTGLGPALGLRPRDRLPVCATPTAGRHGRHWGTFKEHGGVPVSIMFTSRSGPRTTSWSQAGRSWSRPPPPARSCSTRPGPDDRDADRDRARDERGRPGREADLACLVPRYRIISFLFIICYGFRLNIVYESSNFSFALHFDCLHFLWIRKFLNYSPPHSFGSMHFPFV